jgi:hypothetical protein
MSELQHSTIAKHARAGRAIVAARVEDGTVTRKALEPPPHEG